MSRVPGRVRVALEGFSAFERNALASYFRLAGDRFPAYEQTDSLADARFIVADADLAAAVRAVQAAGRVADTVFIGATAPEGALGWMMRPIDPLHVLRELDAAVLVRQAGVQLAAAPPAEGRRVVDMPLRRASDQPPPPREVPPPVLIVAADEASSRALEGQLVAFGLGSVKVNTSEKALELLGRLNFRFVFVDVELDEASGLGGLHLCQRIKRDSGAEPRKVFLTAAAARPVDKVRATLAGADAFLDKPVDDGALRRALSAHGAPLSRPGPLRAIQR